MLRIILFITGLSTEQVFLGEKKSGRLKKDSTCKGIYRKEHTRIPCSKKANFVCRLTKTEWQENKESNPAHSSGEPAANGQISDDFAALFNLYILNGRVSQI